MYFKTRLLVLLFSSLCVMWSCGEEETTEGTSDSEWGRECQSDTECEGETNLCVKNPTEPNGAGYCSIPCSGTSECEGSNMQWTCNVVGSCDMPLASWCGPMDEVEQGMGVVVACE
jgi:hypothetical protein